MIDKLALIHRTSWEQLFRETMRIVRYHRRIPYLDFGCTALWAELASKSRKSWDDLKGSYCGTTIVCIGNGPSLVNTNLSLLNEKNVIGTNRAFQILDKIKPAMFRLVIQDNYRLREIQELLCDAEFPIHYGSGYLDAEFSPPDWLSCNSGKSTVFLPKLCWHRGENYIKLVSDTSPGFSNNPMHGLYYGHSVIFSAIQIAAYLGAKRIVCIGIDMDYSGATSFVPGVKNISPTFSYETDCKEMFIYVRDYLEKKGIELINSTPGGKVDVLKRMCLEDALLNKVVY